MFTLQILDRGQTFLHSLDDRPVSLGSAPEADIQLGEAGVEARHAMIRADAAGVNIEALADLRVNGERVVTRQLNLGDRIEIGRSVLVVGRTVPRAAGPEDVIAEAPSRLRRAPTKKSRVPWLPMLAATAVAVLVAWFAMQADDGSTIRAELRHVASLRESAQLDRAAAQIARLRGQWATATDDRLAQLETEREALLAIEAAEAKLRTSVLDANDGRNYTEWRQELVRLEAEGSSAERIAARVLRSNLRDTIERRPKPDPLPQPAVADSIVAGSANDAAPAVIEGPAQVEPASAAAEIWRSSLAEADRLAGEGQFARALAVLQTTVSEAGDADQASQLRQRTDELRARAVAALPGIVGQARASVDAGKPAAAVSMLLSARQRFPVSPEFGALADELQRAQASVAASMRKVPEPQPTVKPVPVDETVRTATLASLRAQMDHVRAAEEKEAFQEAKGLLSAAAVAVRSRDPDFAQRLEVRAEEAGLLAAFQAELATALGANRTLQTTTTAGMRVTLRAVEGVTMLGRSTTTEQRLVLADLAPAGIDELASQLASGGEAVLGAATLLYKRGETELAERVLTRLVRADERSKAAADPVIARGRGEPFDARGYTLGKSGFVSVRSIELQKEAKQLASRLEAVLRDKNPAARESFLTEVSASGPERIQVLAAAFKQEFERQVAKLEAGSLRKQVESVAAQRALLDQARQHAKDLIYDEVKYFYPYKPPAVSSDKFAEYSRVQAEVDTRVAAVRTLWRDDRARVRVPAGLRQDLDRLDWVAKVLGDLGALDHSTLAAIDWARALPPGDSVTVRDFCLSSAERVELDEWRRIEAYNQIVGKQVSAGQRELLRITNEYRVMFHHRPLAIVTTCCDASQGHAEEMTRLGYFAHMSPTPGRKTPYERMRLAGYMAGVSENIALCDGAQGAHVAWCHSSGHHRNLLNPGHSEIGIGCSGRNWVQNFGSGTAHCEDPAWRMAAVARKD